jgi:hypothetical protein
MRPNLLTALFTFPLLAACGAAAPGSSNDAVANQSDALSKAVPQAAWLELVPPPPDTAPPAGSQTVAPVRGNWCAGGPPSHFGAITAKVTSDANGLANGIFGIVTNVMSNPPTAADAGHAVWGPLTDPQSAAV